MKHKSQLIEYLKMRRKQFETIKPILALYGVDHIVDAQIQGIDVCIQTLNDAGSDERKIESIHFTLKTSLGLRILQQDVESILETGKPVLPEELSQLKGFLDEQFRKKKEEEQAQEKERRKQDQERRREEEAAKKQREQEETLDKLGIKDLIVGLQSR